MVGPQGRGTLTAQSMDAAFAYIAAHAEIWEVILTGGDPLVLSPRRLAEIMQRLAAIEHVKIVRFHTRVPVVEPARIDSDLVAALKASGKTTYRRAARQSSARTDGAGTACHRRDWSMRHRSWSARSVLLKGVNDDVETLAALMRGFVENRIKPYYLHHPDLAPGTGHFRAVDRRRPGAGRRPARPDLRPLPAHLCPRYSRRPRQGGGECLDDRGQWRRLFHRDQFQGRGTRLSAAGLRCFLRSADSTKPATFRGRLRKNIKDRSAFPDRRDRDFDAAVLRASFR